MKRAKSLFKSFCSNVSKTNCTFLLHRAQITRKRNCCVCVARRIVVRQCFLAARNSPKWSQFHIRRSLFVLKKENTTQRYYWKAKKKKSISILRLRLAFMVKFTPRQLSVDRRIRKGPGHKRQFALCALRIFFLNLCSHDKLHKFKPDSLGDLLREQRIFSQILQ